jgi:hypothetical protein
MSDEPIKYVKVHPGRDSYGNPVIGHISFGPVDPNAKPIDVPSIMRAAGYDEGFKAGIEAAVKAVETAYREEAYMSAVDAVTIIRALLKSTSLERTPNGHINNCAIANGSPQSECQMCAGDCPDTTKEK